jgi:hypothetical protein
MLGVMVLFSRAKTALQTLVNAAAASEWPKVWLYRSDVDALVPETFGDGIYFYRVPHNGSRAVALDHSCLIEIQAGILIGLTDQGLMGIRVGHGDPKCLTVRIG